MPTVLGQKYTAKWEHKREVLIQFWGKVCALSCPHCQTWGVVDNEQKRDFAWAPAWKEQRKGGSMQRRLPVLRCKIGIYNSLSQPTNGAFMSYDILLCTGSSFSIPRKTFILFWPFYSKLRISLENATSSSLTMRKNALDLRDRRDQNPRVLQVRTEENGQFSKEFMIRLGLDLQNFTTIK